MNQTQTNFGIGVGQLEGNRAVGDPYQKITCFGQREGRMVVGTKLSFYQNHTEATSGVAMVNQKNPVVVVRFGRGLEESWCGSWGVGYDSKRNEGIKGKGEARKLLPLQNGKVQQLEDGACIYENQTFNLSIEEQEEPSGALGTIKGTYWWNDLRGIQVLPKRQGIVPATNWDLPTCDATSSDVAFQTQQSVNPF